LVAAVAAPSLNPWIDGLNETGQPMAPVKPTVPTSVETAGR
jgi:hypothetical protein